MIYNCLSIEEEINIKNSLKKHKITSLIFFSLAIITILLAFIIVNRNNIRYSIPLISILFTINISIALLINFSFIKIEKEYINLLNKSKENYNQITIGKIVNNYQEDNSSFGRIKCFNIKVLHDEKETIFFLENSNLPNLNINKIYKFTTYRHFILKIEEIKNETSVN